jgi:hypothetical protein
VRLPPVTGHSKARATAISNTETVIGTSFGSSGTRRGFFIRNARSDGREFGTMPAVSRLGLPLINEVVAGLSRDGSQAAGSAGNSTEAQAVIWSGAGFQNIVVLPPLAANGLSFANDVEGNRVVGGASTGPPSVFPFAYQPVVWVNGGNPANLNTLGADAGQANAVNAAGITVGLLRFGGALSGFVHTDADGTILLNTLIDPAANRVIVNATAISELGQILAVTADMNGAQSYAILTPNP